MTNYTQGTTRLAQPLLARHVARELEREDDPRVWAIVDETRGVVRTFLAPTPPEWAGNATEREARRLDGLRREAAELRRVIDHPSTTFVERERARTRLRELERTLADERAITQPWTDPMTQVGRSQPDWSGLTESARGLVTMIACAAIRGEALGSSFERLPAALSEDETLASNWERSDAWVQWLAASPETRRAFVRSACADLANMRG